MKVFIKSLQFILTNYFGHRLNPLYLLSLKIWQSWKKDLLGLPSQCIIVPSDLIIFVITMEIFIDFCASITLDIFSYNPFLTSANLVFWDIEL